MLATETSIISSQTANVAASVATAPALPLGEEIYDIMGGVTLSYPWLSLVGRVSLYILGLYLLFLFYKWLTKPVELVRKPIYQSPETQAFRAIKRLKLSEVWEQQNVKAICENVVAILKNYALDAYRLSIGAAATSDEFIPALIDGKVINQIVSEVKEMLEYCDEVRYTGNSSNRYKPDELVSVLEKLINTKGWCR